MPKTLWERFAFMFYREVYQGSIVPWHMAVVGHKWYSNHSIVAVVPLHYLFIAAWWFNLKWTRYRGRPSWIDRHTEKAIAKVKFRHELSVEYQKTQAQRAVLKIAAWLEKPQGSREDAKAYAEACLAVFSAKLDMTTFKHKGTKSGRFNAKTENKSNHPR